MTRSWSRRYSSEETTDGGLHLARKPFPPSDSGHLRAKVAQEELIENSSIPFSLVHATQFFEFVAGIADGATEAARSGWRRCCSSHRGRRCRGGGLPHRGGLATERAGGGGGAGAVPMDEFFRQALAARNDPREVVTDPHARHFRTELTERSLVPLGDKPRRSPGRGGPRQFPPSLSERSTAHTPEGPWRLRFQALHRVHGLHRDFSGSAPPALTLTSGPLTTLQASLEARTVPSLPSKGF